MNENIKFDKNYGFCPVDPAQIMNVESNEFMVSDKCSFKSKNSSEHKNEFIKS